MIHTSVAGSIWSSYILLSSSFPSTFVPSNSANTFSNLSITLPSSAFCKNPALSACMLVVVVMFSMVGVGASTDGGVAHISAHIFPFSVGSVSVSGVFIASTDCVCMTTAGVSWAR